MTKTYRIIDTMATMQAKQQPCIVCGSQESDPHHLVSRGAGGDDVAWNLMPLCRVDHTAIHKAGLTTYSEKQPAVKAWLEKMGWQFNDFRNKWFAP